MNCHEQKMDWQSGKVGLFQILGAEIMGGTLPYHPVPLNIINFNIKNVCIYALQSLYNNMGGGIIVKKVSFKFILYVDSVTDDVTCDRRLFQVFAAATQNARSPTVRRYVCGTA